MTGLLFCSSVINYIDRVNISVAAPVMMAATGWDKDLFGWVFSIFLVGYAMGQLPGGIIADRWSGRNVLAVAFLGFSLFTLLTPFIRLICFFGMDGLVTDVFRNHIFSFKLKVWSKRLFVYLICFVFKLFE